MKIRSPSYSASNFWPPPTWRPLSFRSMNVSISILLHFPGILVQRAVQRHVVQGLFSEGNMAISRVTTFNYYTYGTQLRECNHDKYAALLRSEVTNFAENSLATIFNRSLSVYVNDVHVAFYACRTRRFHGAKSHRPRGNFITNATRIWSLWQMD